MTRAIFPPTPLPERGVVAWNMNTTCNYRCSYCTQRFMDDRTRWARDVDAFIAGFARLRAISNATWEVKLSGGEPFLHPRFIDVVRGLVDNGFFVGVVTNLSASVDKVRAFLDATGDALTVFSCSLHLEYADVAEFLAKCIAIRDRLPKTSRHVVTSVATHATLPRLRELRAQFESERIAFRVQPEKQSGAVIEYEDVEVQELVQLGGHNGHGVVAHDFLGQPCWSGTRSLIVDDRGEVYRCYPARRKKTERLGNLLDDTLTLLDGPAPCRYAVCTCTVPIARGMMPTDSVRDRFRIEEDAA